jgi:PIN domain nuclease of toxin-antitoxin system
MLGISAEDVQGGMAAIGARLLPIRFPHLSALSSLPAFGHHKDPFDRLLIAQAIAEDMRMLSSDTRFGEYKRLRLIWE